MKKKEYLPLLEFLGWEREGETDLFTMPGPTSPTHYLKIVRKYKHSWEYVIPLYQKCKRSFDNIFSTNIANIIFASEFTKLNSLLSDAQILLQKADTKPFQVLESLCKFINQYNKIKHNGKDPQTSK